MCITLPKFDLERMINKSVTLVFASHARTYQVKEIGRFLRRAFQLKNLKLDLGERNAITYLHSSEIGQLTANILFSGLVESTLIDRFEVKDETSQKQEQE